MAKTPDINRYKLTAEQVTRTCDPQSLPFETTAEIKTSDHPFFGQERADHSIRFGVAIKKDGYNLYVLGRHGAGKHRFTRSILEATAQQQKAPNDWVYIHNFAKPAKPVAIQLETSQAKELKRDHEQLIEALLDGIPSAFASEVYQAHVTEIENEFNDKRDLAMQELREAAKANELELVRSPHGLIFLPTEKGKVIDPKAFEQLPEAKKLHVQSSRETCMNKLQGIMQQIPVWQREAREKIRGLDTEVVLMTLDHVFISLKDKYRHIEKLKDYYVDLKHDVLDNMDVFRAYENGHTKSTSKFYQDVFLRRYTVNVLVSHDKDSGAPVIYEDIPTHDNLLGRVEHTTDMGTLHTDFSLIKSGALHKANGGYLILDAKTLLMEPMAWDALKRCLSSKTINIQSLVQSMGLVSTISLEPELIPLDVKIVLIGSRSLYYLLCEQEPEFNHLFKVAADFEDNVDRNDTTHHALATLISNIVEQENMLPFHRNAVARIIEHSSRLAEEQEKLDINLEAISDILREADFWCRSDGKEVVNALHIQYALDSNEYRQGRVRSRYYESIINGTTVIDTDGLRVAQINALTVIELGKLGFGQPSRVTATARIGDGKVIDIEHESDLGGMIHTKAVLILSHFLSGRFLRHKSLSLSASIAFEQSYAEVEGDSAAVAELCCILSAITDLPLRQDLAVTGSIDQHGLVQAVGGLNEKIEGFFEICKMRGLTGKQGVVLPRTNVPHLMLKNEVVEAISKDQFHIYAVENIDEAITLMFNKSAGVRNKQGDYPKTSVNFAVEETLKQMTEAVSESHEHGDEKKEKESH